MTSEEGKSADHATHLQDLESAHSLRLVAMSPVHEPSAANSAVAERVLTELIRESSAAEQ